MQLNTFYFALPILALCTLVWNGNSQLQAQSRTSGNSRNPGNPNPAPRTVAPPSPLEGNREIGRTRQSDAVIQPTPAASRNTGRTHHEPAPPVSTTPDPSPPSQHPPRMPPVHIYDCPKVIIIDQRPTGGYIVIDGDDAESGETIGLWIRDGIRYGRGVTLAGNFAMPEYSGYDFSELMKRSSDDQFTDMFVDEEADGLMMTVSEDTEIMDIGAVFVPENSIYVPRREWSLTHTVSLIPGHEYVILTWDQHYAKFLVTSLLQNRVVFDWTYQYATGDDSRTTALEVKGPKGDRFQR